jgi:hypothetical protein
MPSVEYFFTISSMTEDLPKLLDIVRVPFDFWMQVLGPMVLGEEVLGEILKLFLTEMAAS